MDGRIRIRNENSSLKIGIFIYSFLIRSINFNIENRTAEFILRTKIRELLKNIEKLF